MVIRKDLKHHIPGIMIIKWFTWRAGLWLVGSGRTELSRLTLPTRLVDWTEAGRHGVVIRSDVSRLIRPRSPDAVPSSRTITRGGPQSWGGAVFTGITRHTVGAGLLASVVIVGPYTARVLVHATSSCHAVMAGGTVISCVGGGVLWAVVAGWTLDTLSQAGGRIVSSGRAAQRVWRSIGTVASDGAGSPCGIHHWVVGRLGSL
jgi:hypothetical protein